MGMRTYHRNKTPSLLAYGERKTFQIHSLKATDKTKISVLGHNGKVLEYASEVDPSPKIKNTDNGMEISVMRSQRIYNDKQWSNPIVVKIEEIDIAKD